MAYMVYQRYTSAVKRAYRGRPDVSVQHTRAIEFRAWLESLEIDAAIRADLVEQARALEHGFEELVRSPPQAGETGPDNIRA